MRNRLLVGVMLGTVALGCTRAQVERPKTEGEGAGARERDAGDEERLKPTPEPDAKNKVYVPVSLEDAFVELKKMLPPQVLREMKEGTEEDMIKYHSGLGMWLRNNWGLWGGSRLAVYFNDLGINHPDDMSGIVLDTFWCHLNSKPLGLEKRVTYYQTYWKVNQEPENKSCPEDGSLLDVNFALSDKTEDGMPRAIHGGRCKKNQHLWVFEHDKGWYKPTKEQLKRIE